jgi:hypothetical protein
MSWKANGSLRQGRRQDSSARCDAPECIGLIHSCGSPEISRLHLDAIDMEVRDVDITRPQTPGREVALVQTEATAIADLIAPSVR